MEAMEFAGCSVIQFYIYMDKVVLSSLNTNVKTSNIAFKKLDCF